MRRQEHIRAGNEQREGVIQHDGVGAVLVKQIGFLLVYIEPRPADDAAVEGI